MSEEYKGQDPLDIAKEAERDLNSYGAKQGHSSGTKDRMAVSDSSMYIYSVCALYIGDFLTLPLLFLHIPSISLFNNIEIQLS